MDDEIISSLSKEIVEKFKSKLNIEEEMKSFIETSITKDTKKKVLELLYLCQLYSDAYIGPDPRGKLRLLSNVYSVLKAQNEEEVKEKIVNLERIVTLMKNAETNPILTTKIKLEDIQKYKGVKF